MGAKQTKISELCTDVAGDPNGHQMKTIKQVYEMRSEDQELLQNRTPLRTTENLRRRFFKGFTYNLNDPRSPSLLLNRTPLVFEDKSDKTLNLDDTFADLSFVTNQTYGVEKMAGMIAKEETAKQDQYLNDPTTSLMDFKSFDTPLTPNSSGNESASVEFVSLHEEETMESPALLQQTPLVLQQTLDPRSPTIGLTRTPLVFDDDEAQEDALLEDILTTLSLDFSSANNSKSFDRAEISLQSTDMKPVNKHLDRVRAAKKPEKPIRKNKHLAQKQRIYLDCQDVKLTPIRKSSFASASPKRTPLSCVKNRVHLRSRSVECSDKALKPKLSLTSYDDTLNPISDRRH